MEFDVRYKFSNDDVKHTRSVSFTFYFFIIQDEMRDLHFTLQNFIVDQNCDKILLITGQVEKVASGLKC